MQYLPNKKHHRFGIKLWVLADSTNRYVYKLKVYTGASNDTEKSEFGQPYDVMSLMDGLLDKGHTMITENFYTSVPLASVFTYQHETQLVGTLRGNRKYLPSVTKCKVGEQVAYIFWMYPSYHNQVQEQEILLHKKTDFTKLDLQTTEKKH
ncbi:UNVERIFIED_CONTAM: hypothetical protein FKN15_032513 [Acipenser sinensis]